MTLKGTIALTLVAALAGGSLPAAAQGPIRIGASLSLTGTYAKLGKNQHEGYQLCIKELNAKGGLLGRKLDLVMYDDQSLPPTAVRLYEKLITEDKVDAVMGPYSSPVSEAAANVTEKYKKVMVAPLAATTSIFKKGRKYMFMVISPAEGYLEGLVDMAAKRGLKTVAVVNEDTLFSKAAASGAVELAKKKGLQVVFTEAYPKGNTDFSALLTKLRAANPDVVAAATYFDDAVALTRQMKELNVNPKMYGVTVGGDLPEFYDTLKQNAEYIYGATQWEHTLPYPGNQEFFDTYKKEFAHEPSYHSAAGYAGCLIYAEGVRRAGSLDADKVREALLKLELKTALSPSSGRARRRSPCGPTTSPRARRASRRRPGTHDRTRRGPRRPPPMPPPDQTAGLRRQSRRSKIPAMSETTEP
ncbi:MAG: branched-chain amino acid ABC transporter substrate-binding protein [Candidatus Rokuibacteriota bacterium]|nr:MAG: branched-chain amino acid ABC transporter substrate-binding protein [Candidatus Rokubacteria bacterium]